MDDREWQTFVTVVDEGNITRAAEKLFFIATGFKLSVASYGKSLGPFSVVADC